MTSRITGLHHVTLKAAAGDEFLRTVAFYRDVLGLAVATEWETGIMLSLGDGSCIEVFANAGVRVDGVWDHVALRTDDVAAMTAHIAAAGYPVTLPPRDIELSGKPCTISFVRGPLGEHIELFCER